MSGAGADDSFQRGLFRDRVADLHDAADGLARVMCQFCRRERRTVQSIAARAPTERHTQITRLRITFMLPLASQAHAAAEYQWIGGIVGVVKDRAVDGGDAHLVAIVFDAGHDASRDAARM